VKTNKTSKVRRLYEDAKKTRKIGKIDLRMWCSDAKNHPRYLVFYLENVEVNEINKLFFVNFI